MALVHAKNTVNDILKKACINYDTLAVLRICENELGNLKKMVHVAGKNGLTLFLKADNPVYFQEIMIRRKELIKKINSSFGEKVVNEIRII